MLYELFGHLVDILTAMRKTRVPTPVASLAQLMADSSLVVSSYPGMTAKDEE